MTERKIVYIPESCLRIPSKPVTVFDAQLQTLIDDMFLTMYAAPGVGLAAPQIGINLRVAVIDVTHDKSQQLVLINPEIIEASDDVIMQEGCLSVPGNVYEKVTRANQVLMRATDREGNEYTLSGEGLLAQAIQHEIDHLDGKVFIDKLSRLKRTRIEKKVKNYLARHESA